MPNISRSVVSNFIFICSGQATQQCTDESIVGMASPATMTGGGDIRQTCKREKHNLHAACIVYVVFTTVCSDDDNSDDDDDNDHCINVSFSHTTVPPSELGDCCFNVNPSDLPNTHPPLTGCNPFDLCNTHHP